MTQFMFVFMVIAIFGSQSRAADCGIKLFDQVSLISEYTIIATVNETLQWDMRKNFFSGEDLVFSTEPRTSSFATTQQPISRVGYPSNHGEEDIGVVLSIKSLTNQETGAWENDFIFLEQNATDVDVHYSLNDPINTEQTPFFSTFRNVHKDGEGLKCFDVDFVTETIVIIDCTTETAEAGLSNGFVIIDLLSDFKQLQVNDNPHNYNKTSARKIVTRNYTFKLGQEELEQEPFQLTAKPFLFRGEPAWGTEQGSKEKLDDDCELEVYKLDIKQSGTVNYVVMLNKTVLSNITGQDIKNFTLLDFQVEPNGDIYVLDAFNGVYRLDLLISNTFELLDWIENPSKEQLYAFDFNYLVNTDGSYTQHLVLAYKDRVVIYENFIQRATFQLPNTAVYGELQLQMSQEYLVIRQKQGTYLFHLDEKLLLQKFEDNFEQLLINPYYPDLIGINEQTAYRYELSKGYLQLINQNSKTDAPGQFTLKATPQKGGASCPIIIHVQVLGEGNTTVIRTSDDPFPDEITYPSKPIVVDMLASGPSLTYKQTKEHDLVDITLESIWEMKLEGVEFPPAKDVSYADMLVLDNTSRFYIFIQVPSEECTIYRCKYDLSNKQKAVCSQIDNFLLPFIINKKQHSFAWWQEWNMVTYIYQDTDYTVQIYTSAGGQSDKSGSIEYPSTDVTQKITSITMLQNAIYVVQKDRKEVDIWRTFNPIQQIYTINQKVLEAQGFPTDEVFTPIAVYGSRKIKAQVVFIQTLTSVLIGEFANINNIHTFHLQKIIKIIPNSEVSIAIGPKTFTIVQKTATEQIMEEYNWQHMHFIELNKHLPLYNYRLQEPLNIDYSSQSGWLFARAYDDAKKQTVILLYEPNVPAHVSLHKVIETGYNINDAFDMAIDGNETMFVYFNDNKQNKVYAILQDAIVSIVPKPDTPIQYVTKVDTSLEIDSTIASLSYFAPVVVKESIKFMNTNSEMVVLQSWLDKKNTAFTFKNQTGDQVIEMSTDWFIGQPTTLFVLCKQCGDQITIQEPVVPVSDGKDMKYTITDGWQYDATSIVYQASSALIFQSKNGTMLSRIDLSKELGFDEKCELLTVTDDSKYIISSVIGSGGVKVLVNECTNQSCKQFLQGEQQLAGVTQPIKMRFVFGRNFLVLNTDPLTYTKFESSIVIYAFTTSATAYTISISKIINTKQLGAATPVYIADFCHLSVSESIYAVLLTDINNGVWIANFGSNMDGTVTELNRELINLKGFDHEQYYLKGDTHFHQLKVLAQEKADKKLKIQLLVTTSNVASYIFYLELDISKDTGASLERGTLALQQVLLPYGDWKSVNKMSYTDGYISIAYTDGNEVVLGLYPIEVSVKKLDKVKQVSFFFGVREDYTAPLPIDFVMLLTQYENKPFLFANIKYDSQQQEHLVLKYSITQKLSMNLKNCSTLQEQELKLYAANSFNSAYGTTKLWDSDNVPDPESGSSNWWWITLIVIGSVALLGVGGFFLYKHFVKKNVDPLLG